MVFLLDIQGSYLYATPIAELLTAWMIAAPSVALTAPPLPFLGRISYGIYLWHVPLSWDRPNTLEEFPVIFWLSVALASLSYYGVERWFRRAPRRVPAPHAFIPESQPWPTPSS